MSDDHTSEIFISPELDKPVEILAVVTHEMVHAIVGNDCGHKGAFVKLCKKIGLVGPWTATTAGPELAEKLAIYAAQLGPYPHARLNAQDRKKQSRRRSARIRTAKCGRTARAANRTQSEYRNNGQMPECRLVRAEP